MKRRVKNDGCRCDPGCVGKALPFLVLTFLLLSPGCRHPSGPKPPDLSACTRLEVHDPRGAINYVLSNSELYVDLFSPDEMAYVKSFATYVVDDPEAIGALAQGVSRGMALRRPPTLGTSLEIQITGYRGDERVTSFQASFGLVKAEDGHMFKYANGLPSLSLLRPKELQPFRLRLDCASHQSKLRTDSLLFRQNLIAYPDPNHWCNITADVLWRLQGGHGARQRDPMIRGAFTCPAAAEKAGDARSRPAWISDYAMNPDCRPNSPPDTVLLFEAKPGWNQHGGPELFTFDNHDPNGGCVLLNDGTVKFIRTKEELAQLRWKP